MSSFRPLFEIDSHWPACGEGSWDRPLRSDIKKSAEALPWSARRDVLSRTIEAEVIPRLMLAHLREERIATGKVAPAAKPDTQDVDEFIRIMLAHDISIARSFVAALCAQGMPLEVVFIDLFSASAQRLGDMWVTDECDFTDVTIALSRLQQLLREFSPEFEGAVELSPEAPRALLVAAPGEQHTFGIFIVEEFFRRAGWDVHSGSHQTQEEVVNVARGEPFDVVGLSVSCDPSIDALASFISTIRKHALNPALRVLVGGRFFLEHPEFVERVGADATAPNGRRAVPQLSNLLDTTAVRY